MDTEELFLKGDELYDQGAFNEAFAFFSLAAENGDTSCMLRVASMYTCGEGVDCDYDKAIEWELKAVSAGDATAMFNVGISYRFKGDIRQAKRWFLEALEAGDGSAALELARLYMVSEKESETVIKYLHLAVESENISDASIEEAYNLLSEMA